MFISREKFEQMEYELEQEKIDKEFWHMMSNDWKDTSTDYRSRYNSSEKFADKLIEEKGDLEAKVEHYSKELDILRDEYRSVSIENEQLRGANCNLYTDYIDTLDDNELLQNSLNLSIEALKENQKHINNLKQEKELLKSDLNTLQSDKKYYRELYLRGVSY